MRLFDIGWNPDTTDEWYTPPYIFNKLGLTFDLDPASPPGGLPWVPALRHYSIIDDGLIHPWDGIVWLNPPYSAPGAWLAKLREHGTGIALVAGDFSTDWFHESVVPSDQVCFLRSRIRFVSSDIEKSTSGRFPSVLASYGDVCAEALRDSGLGWCP